MSWILLFCAVPAGFGVTGGEWHFSRGQAGAEASLRESLAQLQGAA